MASRGAPAATGVQGVQGAGAAASGSVGSVTQGELTTRLRDHDVDAACSDAGSRLIGVLLVTFMF